MDFVPFLKGKYQSTLGNAKQNQIDILAKIVTTNRNTEYGKLYDFKNIVDYKDFKNTKINRYADLECYIERMSFGEEKILTDEKPIAFARTSGTISSSKFIPTTKSFLNNNHYFSSRLLLYALWKNHGFKGYVGKSLSLSGYCYENYNNSKCIDISALLIEQMPFFFKLFNFPNTNFFNWDEKLDYLLKNVKHLENVKIITGVPTWVLSLMRSIEDHTEQEIITIFKNLKLYIHGGVNCDPYLDSFKELFGEQLNFLETYNTTEAFFGFQDKKDDKSLLLISNADVFYEFIPYQYRCAIDYSQAIPIWQVERGKMYLLLITTSSGLYRYVMGDVIEFSSLYPYKIKILGRDQEYINAFGEHLNLSQVNNALIELKQKLSFEIKDFFVVPKYITSKSKGCHEWYIEFRKPPNDMENFSYLLDHLIQKYNISYKQKRYKSRVLDFLNITTLSIGDIDRYLSKRGKIGGQIKIRKLHNNRDILNNFFNTSPVV